MRTLSSEWIAAMTSGASPVYAVEMELGPIAYLTVNDYSVGAGDEISVYADGVLQFKLTEGVHFAAATSNTATAAAIVSAGAFPLNSFSRGARVVYIPTVRPTPDTITIESTDTGAWSASPGYIPKTVGFVSGGTPVEGYSSSIDAVESLAMTIDPMTRVFSVGQVEITFNDDGALRSLLERTFPRGRTLTIKLGTATLPIASFETLGKYVITDYRPSPGQIVIDCEEPPSRLADSQVAGHIIDVHPYAMLLWLLDNANVPDEFRDDASLDSTADADVSHWSVSRTSLLARMFGRPEMSTNIITSTKAKDLFDSLLTLVQGSYIGNEDGTYSFRRYDGSAAVVRTLTADDIDDVEYRGMTENLTTGVDVVGLEDGDPVKRAPLFSLTDELSETVHASAALYSSTTYRKRIDSDWLGLWGRLIATIDKTTTTILVQHAIVAGLSGTRPAAPLPALTQRTEDTLDASHVAYYLLSDGRQSEIVKAKTHTALASQFDEVTGLYTDPALAGSTVYVPGWSEFTVERAQQNTTAKDWTYNQGVGSVFIPEVRVYDVTLAVHAASTILERFNMGAPIAKVRTSLRHLDLQLGDFIAFEDDVFVHYGANGSDATVVWEIISKEIQALDDSPGITFTLAWVRDDFAPAPIPVASGPFVVEFPVSFSDVITTDAGEIVTDEGGEPLYRG